MIAYHFDRLGTLTGGQVLSLDQTAHNQFGGLLSQHGNSYTTALLCSDPSCPDFSNAIIENNIEALRRQDFPHHPSRYQSTFALQKPEDLHKWSEYLHITNDSILWEIEFNHDDYFLADARHLLGMPVIRLNGDYSDAMSVVNHYREYWNGDITSYPLPELVVKLPIKIKRRIAIPQPSPSDNGGEFSV